MIIHPIENRYVAQLNMQMNEYHTRTILLDISVIFDSVVISSLGGMEICSAQSIENSIELW